MNNLLLQLKKKINVDLFDNKIIDYDTYIKMDKLLDKKGK